MKVLYAGSRDRLNQLLNDRDAEIEVLKKEIIELKKLLDLYRDKANRYDDAFP